MNSTTVDALIDSIRRIRDAAAGRNRRVFLALASIVFFAGAYLAWRQLPDDISVVRWVPLLLVAAVGVPAMMLLNAFEYQAMARMASVHVRLGDSLRVAVVGTAANLAPVPGAVLVRWNDLSRRGVRHGQAINASVVAGAIWLGLSSLAVAASTLGESMMVVVTSISVACLSALGAMAVHRRMEFSGTWGALIAIEFGVLVVSALRAGLILSAFGLSWGWQAPVAMAGSYALANIIGVFPGGLGLREVLSGFASRPVVGEAATGFLVSAVDRLIGLIIHAPLALMLARQRRVLRLAGTMPESESVPDRRQVSSAPRPRLLVITSTFPARADDGRPAFVRDLSAREASEFDVTVLTPRMNEETIDPDGLDVRRFPYFVRRFEGLADEAILPTLRAQKWRWVEVPFLLGAMVLATLVTSRRIRPAIVHAHWAIPGGLAAYCNFLIHKTPYIVTVHGADVHALKSGFAIRLKRSILRRASAIVPVSGEAQAAVVAMDPMLRTTVTEVVPMGVEAPEPLATERLRSLFLFVGRIAEKKGLDVVIEAMARVSGAQLDIVGSGPSQAAAERLVTQLGLRDRIRFLGRLSRAEVLLKMREASALVIPSVIGVDGDREGTPVVLAEAFSLGLPVVASRVGGLAELIRHQENGLLVDPGDPELLAEAIATITRDPILAKRIGDEARIGFASSPMNLKWTSDRYLSILEVMAAK